MLDYSALLYRPIFNTLGVIAQMTLDGKETFDIPTLDKTTGVAVGGMTEVQTVVPAAIVMMADLAAESVDPAAVDDGILTLNGKTWTIRSHKIAPSPNGEADGQLYLFLSA